MKPIKALGFNGMANVKRSPASLMDDNKRITPRFVLNARVLDDGRVVRRGGYRRVVFMEGSGAHSLWAGSVMLVVANQCPPYVPDWPKDLPTIYMIEGQTVQFVGSAEGPLNAPMEYVEVDGQVYLSNGYWSGRYDLSTRVLGEWGMPLPPLPNISMVDGNLPPGVYKVCYTYFEEPARLSGSGPLVEVSWDGGSMGIKLNGMPSNALAWITQPSGKEFYLAPVQAGVISEPYYTQPLLSFGVQAPPALRALTQAFGRLWGAVGGKLYYSEEFQYEWFRPDGYLAFPEDIVMTAPVNSGIFVNSLKTTWMLSGTTPAKMKLEKLGDGAVPGSLAYVMVEGTGYELSRRFARTPSPAWATSRGIVVGTQTGKLVHLTEGNLRINPRARGAAIYRDEGGQPVALFSLGGPMQGAVDSEITAINSRGRLYVPAPVRHEVAGGVAIGGEGEYS